MCADRGGGGGRASWETPTVQGWRKRKQKQRLSNPKCCEPLNTASTHHLLIFCLNIHPPWYSAILLEREKLIELYIILTLNSVSQSLLLWSLENPPSSTNSYHPLHLSAYFMFTVDFDHVLFCKGIKERWDRAVCSGFQTVSQTVGLKGAVAPEPDH